TILDALDTLGFTGYRIVMNHRKLLAAMARYAGLTDEQAGPMIRALDKLDKIGRAGVLAEMERYELPANAAARALDLATLRVDGDNLALLPALAVRLADDAEAQAALDDLHAILQLLSSLS